MVLTFWWVLIWKNVENIGKMAVFVGWIWPDRRNTALADMA